MLHLKIESFDETFPYFLGKIKTPYFYLYLNCPKLFTVAELGGIF